MVQDIKFTKELGGDLFNLHASLYRPSNGKMRDVGRGHTVFISGSTEGLRFKPEEIEALMPAAISHETQHQVLRKLRGSPTVPHFKEASLDTPEYLRQYLPPEQVTGFPMPALERALQRYRKVR